MRRASKLAQIFVAIAVISGAMLPTTALGWDSTRVGLNKASTQTLALAKIKIVGTSTPRETESFVRPIQQALKNIGFNNTIRHDATFSSETSNSVIRSERLAGYIPAAGPDIQFSITGQMDLISANYMVVGRMTTGERLAGTISVESNGVKLFETPFGYELAPPDKVYMTGHQVGLPRRKSDTYEIAVSNVIKFLWTGVLAQTGDPDRVYISDEVFVENGVYMRVR